ncbi:MAG TPA: GNAT family N-acetyltransferase [Ktedonobacteraceae bacterium]|nr:GNAT family N-acetyltransferase [Ktedonobacteraceae bacterium]
MSITSHEFRGETDMSRVLDLVRRVPLPSRHLIDLPWRLCSPTINEGHDAAFWEDAEGQVVGFAAWQYYWAALDFFILPAPQMQEVEAALFAWADERFRELDEERGHPLPYWVEFCDDDRERQQLIEAHGFMLEVDYSYISLQHMLVDLAPVPALPDGFLLRSLAGESEVAELAEMHRMAFESTAMTTEWRTRVIHTSQYRPELDLVICAPDGSLVGSCLGWFEPSRLVAQIEPISVHPRFQRRGLGRILLLEMLHRFQAHGASSAIIEPSIENAPIRKACESVGFQMTHTIRRRGKLLNQ